MRLVDIEGLPGSGVVTPSWALGVPLVYLLLFPERNGAFGARQIRLPNLDREEPEK
jgi:hypothetical protein